MLASQKPPGPSPDLISSSSSTDTRDWFCWAQWESRCVCCQIEVLSAWQDWDLLHLSDKATPCLWEDAALHDDVKCPEGRKVSDLATSELGVSSTLHFHPHFIITGRRMVPPSISWTPTRCLLVDAIRMGEAGGWATG